MSSYSIDEIKSARRSIASVGGSEIPLIFYYVRITFVMLIIILIDRYSKQKPRLAG